MTFAKDFKDFVRNFMHAHHGDISVGHVVFLLGYPVTFIIIYYYYY